MNVEDLDPELVDRLIAIQKLKETGILKQDELFDLYAGVREYLGLPPRDFKKEQEKEDKIKWKIMEDNLNEKLREIEEDLD